MTAVRRRPSFSFFHHWAVDVLLRTFLALGLSLVVLWFLIFIGQLNGDRPHPKWESSVYGHFFLTCFVSPLIENGILIFLFVLFMKWSSSWSAIIFAAACVATLHGINEWQRAMIVFPGFIVFASTYNTYKCQHYLAYFRSCLVHASDNAIILLLTILIDKQ